MSRKKTNKKLSELVFENVNVKSSWADFAVSHLKPKHIIYRYDDRRKNRFYYFFKDKEIVIGAGSTTVFGKVSTERERLEEWKKNHPNWEELLNVSAEYGSLCHVQKGNIMFGKGVDKDMLDTMVSLVVKNGGNRNTPLKDMLAFMKFQEDFQLKPLLIEASLAWQDPNTGEWLCQTIDLLAELWVTEKNKETVQDGVYVRGAKAGQPKYKDVVTEKKVKKTLLIDFKSNFFEKDKKSFFEVHQMQLMAAKLAVEQNFPEIKVDDLYNFAENSWKTEPSYTFYKWDVTDKDWELLYSYWKTAQLKGINKPQGNILVTEGFKSSSDFKLLTYREYVEQVLMKSA